MGEENWVFGEGVPADNEHGDVDAVENYVKG